MHLPMIFYLLTTLFPMRLSRHIDILKLKTFVFLSNIWGIETLLFGILIIRLVSTNTWIVYQDQGKLLNGIEYYMFCWICAVVPITVVMAGKILAFLCLAFAEGKEAP